MEFTPTSFLFSEAETALEELRAERGLAYRLKAVEPIAGLEDNYRITFHNGPSISVAWKLGEGFKARVREVIEQHLNEGG